MGDKQKLFINGFQNIIAAEESKLMAARANEH
jgi:hypothetical protein